ncbi:MAG: site-2 protease family protein [Clostridiaceae bacterium]
MNGNFILYLYALPAILISLSFHEMAHAYASYRHGDPTAKNLGRLTMNPLKHLDPFGTLMLVISLYSGFGFGWAKPVPINPGYYKNPKRGTIMVSLAGPLSNLLLAMIFSFPMAIIAYRSGSITLPDIYNSSLGIYGSGFTAQSIIFNICRFFYTINIGLAVFNIIPIPPLDGSKILTAVLPAKQYYSLMRYEQYIGIAFLALMLLKPGILSTIMWPFRKVAEGIFMILGKLVFNLFG